MTSAKFDLHKWLNYSHQGSSFHQKALTETEKGSFGERDRDVESVLAQIEGCRLDLTCSYQDWLSLGFAFADEYGVFGSDYFHRVSCFHPKYNAQECEAQYRKCLRRKGGITIRTFFWMAAQAGITPGG